MDNGYSLVFGATNHINSINKKWATWLAKELNLPAYIIDLNDFEMPIYSVHREHSEGIPSLAFDLYKLIGDSDNIIVSFAEYNGSYTSSFKNILDWLSRIDIKVFQNKKCIFTAVSPSKTGGKYVLEQASNRFPSMGAHIIGTFHLPSFNHFFDPDKGITDIDTKQEYFEFISKVKSNI